MPQGIIEDFAQAGQETSLNAMAEAFEERYCGPRSSSEWLDIREMRKLMQSLWYRLEQPLAAATMDDPNWQNDHQDLLEFYGGRVSGQTHFADYDSGNIASRISAWNKRAAQTITKCKAADDGDVLAALCTADLRPFEVIFYLQRSVFKISYREMVDTATTPLRVLAESLEARYAKRQVDANLVTNHFTCLRQALGLAVECAPRPERIYRDYKSLYGRTIGDTTLKDYEISRLAVDIPNWTNSIRKSLLNWYFGVAVEKRARVGE
jgi:hypothetical protein